MPVRSSSVTKDLHTIQVSLRQMLRALERLSATLANADARGAHPRPTVQLTTARRAALKLQGQYLGHMHHLAPAQRARIKKIRAAKGLRAAIAVAKKLSR